jgi:hypothetical protein
MAGNLRIQLTNPAHIKLHLLCEGIAFDREAVAEVGTRFSDRRTVYNNADQPLRDLNTIPPELLLPHEVVVGVRYRPASPWRVVALADGGFEIQRNGEPICPVKIPRRPRYYGVPIREGLAADQIVTQYSVFALGIFMRRTCHYWDVRLPCKFCSIEPTRRTFKGALDRLPLPAVVDAVRTALRLEPTIHYLEWCGGNDEDLDAGFMEVIDAIRAVQPFRPKELRQHLLLMPPFDHRLLVHLPLVEEPTFSLEVWDPDLFQEVCPGKNSLYGRDRFLGALAEGVRVLGRGQLSCNFVAGLEPVDSLISGCETLARMGVVPTAAVFHPDRGTAYAKKSPPSVEEMLKLVAALRTLYRREGYRPWLVGSRRASVDGEIYQGYFDA